MSILRKCISLLLCIIFSFSFFLFPSAYAEESEDEEDPPAVLTESNEETSDDEEEDDELPLVDEQFEEQDITPENNDDDEPVEEEQEEYLQEEYSQEEEQQAHTHIYEAVVTEPTCYEEGYTIYSCTCGDSYIDDYQDALNHPEIVDVSEVPATETEPGHTAGTICSVCGEVISGCDVIPILETEETENIRSFDDDIITGFSELEVTEIEQEYKPVLSALLEIFPTELTVYFGGKVLYEEDSEGEFHPADVSGAEAKTIYVAWRCADDQDYDTEFDITFVPDLDGFTLADGLEIPAIQVHVGEVYSGPTDSYFPDDIPVIPIVGSAGLLRGEANDYYNAYEADLLPPVRDQGSEGACWAFAALGAVETDMLHDGRSVDGDGLSESYLAYYTTHSYAANALRNGPTRDTAVFSGNDYLGHGGNEVIAYRTMANSIGPVWETAGMYSSSYVPGGNETQAVQVTGTYLINPMDRSGIKAAIRMHGGVAVSMHSAMGTFYSATHNSYYCPISGVNHAVMLVGWDDSFSRDDFMETPYGGLPEGDGAWLVRNSWGTSLSDADGYGQCSYFWMSYYDEGLLSSSAVAYDVESGVYDYCYAYDTVPYPAGWVELEANEPISQSYTITGNEAIKAVGFETISANLEATISVKVGNADPVITHAWTSYAGFYLVSLSSPIAAKAGDRVTVTLSFPTAASLAIEWSGDYQSYGGIRYTAVLDGGGFADNNGVSPYDVRMKLYTVANTDTSGVKPVTSITLNQTSLMLELQESEQLIATIDPADATNKEISWSSSNPGVAAVDNGLVIGSSPGTAIITAAARNNQSATCTVTVNGIHVSSVQLSDKLPKDENGHKYLLVRDEDQIDLDKVYFSFSCTVLPENASNKTVDWSSSNESVMYPISYSGEFAVLDNGETDITVTTRDRGLTDSVHVIIDVSTYTVSYDANGGSGAPPSQKKYHATPLTLSDTRPTRPGYSFEGWSTDQRLFYAQFQPGDEYAQDESVMLYAVWKEDPIEQFVRRCYLQILGREGEESGVNNWVNRMKTQNLGCAQIVSSFMNSAEYTGKGNSNEQTVTILYRTMLNREPDEGGKANWLRYLDAGMSPDYVIRGFAGSEEFRNLCASYGLQPGMITLTQNRDKNYQITAYVSRCYRQILGREGDIGGLNNWTGQMLNGSKQGASIVNSFITSAEFRNRRLSNDASVEILYQAMLGRASDVGGKANWMLVLEDGVSLSYVVAGFAKSAEFKRVCSTYGIQPGTVALTEYRDRNINVTRFVNRNYKSALVRSGEPGGLNNWCERIINKKQTPKQCAYNFVFSQECINRNLNDESFLKMLYHLYLGREPDQSGFNNWMNRMKTGMTRQQVANSFGDSAEFKKIVAGYGL